MEIYYQMLYSCSAISRYSTVTNISFSLFIQFILLHLFHFEETEVSLVNMAILFSVRFAFPFQMKKQDFSVHMAFQTVSFQT